MRNLIPTLSLVLLFSVFSCQKEEPQIEEEDQTYNEDVILLNDQSVTILDSIDRENLYFSELGDQLKDLKVNDVLVAYPSTNAPEGFMRIINEINSEDGNVRLKTSYAALTDVFCNFEFDYQADASTLGNRIKDIDTTAVKLYDKDGNPNTTDDQIEISMVSKGKFSPDLKVIIRDCNLEYLRFGGTYESSMSINARIGISAENFAVPDDPILPEIPLFSTGIFNFKGVLRPRVNGSIGSNFEFNYTESGTRQSYIEFSDGNWESFESKELDPIEDPLNVDVTAQLTAGIDLNVELQLFDMSDLRASAGFASYLSAEATLNPTQGNLLWEIKACIAGLTKLILKPFNHSFAEYEHKFFEYCFYENSGNLSNQCNDGIQNGDEEGVDCGGTECPPCPCEHPDYDGLVSFYDLTNGSQWLSNGGWMQDCEPCNWFGITCNALQRVETIELSANNLSGELTTFLGTITELKELDLSNNSIGGNIPASLFSASELESIQLQQNNLDSEIPQNIEDLENLVVFNAANNQLNGNIPAQLANINTLSSLRLSANQFSGCIENELASLCDIDIDFSQNQSLPFGGDIEMICSSNIGFCQGCLNPEAHNYNEFAISGNDDDCETCEDGELNGDEVEVDCGGEKCPPCPCDHPDYNALMSLFQGLNGQNWTNKTGWLEACDPCNWYGIACDVNERVVGLDLKNNNLSGQIPDDFIFSEIRQIDFSSNNITGQIPISFSQNQRLVSIQIQDNGVTGQLPNDWGLMSFLTLINLENNNLSGMIPANFAQLNNINVINLRNNNLSGCVPNALTILCPADLILSQNNQMAYGGDFSQMCDSGIGLCEGCTDQAAHNYNSFATESDNSVCETCEDGILNGDEEDVDCGGSKCEECDICYDDKLIDSRDGNEYKIKLINNRWWMVENLRYFTPKSICVNSDNADCNEFGRYYSVLEQFGDCGVNINSNQGFVQGVCPNGWHMPTLDDAIDFLGVHTEEILQTQGTEFTIYFNNLELLNSLGLCNSPGLYGLQFDENLNPETNDTLLYNFLGRGFYTSTLISDAQNANTLWPHHPKRYILSTSEDPNDPLAVIWLGLLSSGLSSTTVGSCAAEHNGEDADFIRYQGSACRCVKDY